MIVSASRRTDVPCLYMAWLAERLRAGYVLTRNPMNAGQVRQVSLRREDVEGLVLWSKQPAPLLAHLGALTGYTYYVQYTLNAYGPEVEPGLPSVQARLDTLRALVDAMGQGAAGAPASRVLWRYDPILLSERYTLAWHVERFGEMARAVRGYTRRATVSFLDDYARTAKRMAALGARAPEDEEKRALAAALAPIARENGLVLCTCAEEIDLSAYGVGHAACVDAALLSALSGQRITARKDAGQRAACGCARSVDIGAYHTCTNGCAYCYANASQGAAARGATRHDPAGESLV